MNRIDHYHNSLFLKQTFMYLMIALFFIVFGAVYELFSHEVYSYYMLYAFAVPLVLGALPCSIFAILSQKKRNLRIFNRQIFFFWTCGIITLTFGCVFRGVLDIYGTGSRLIIVYPVAGGCLLATALCLTVISARRYRNVKASSVR